MADGRMLKKVICESPRLAALKNDTHRLIYTWLIPHLDIEGRHSADPRLLKSHIAPILDHITHKIIEAALKDMSLQGLISLYTINGNKYLELQRFKKHQNLREDREKKSDIPEPLREASGSTPGVVQEPSGITPKQVKLSEVKLNKANAREEDLPVDNSEPEYPPFEPDTPKKDKSASLEKPKTEQPKTRNGKDPHLVELQNLIAQVKTKYPKYPIETWYAKNRAAPIEKILQVLQNLLKAELKVDSLVVIDTYLQKSIDVEVGKSNAAEFDKIQAVLKKPIPGEMERVGNIFTMAAKGGGAYA